MVVTADAPPLAPRPFRLRAIDAVSVFLLLFGGIWAVVDVAVVVGLSAAGGPFWNDLILDRRGVAVVATIDSVERTHTRVNGRYVNRVACTFSDAAGTRQATSALTTSFAVIGAPSGDADRDRVRPTIAGARAAAGGARVNARRVHFHSARDGARGGGPVCARAPPGQRASRHLRSRPGGSGDGHGGRGDVDAGQRPAGDARRLQLRDDHGAARGRTSTRRPPPVGAPIWILYDASDPKRSVAA